MIKLTGVTNKPQSPFYKQLLGVVDEQLLHLQDARETFLIDKVHDRNLKYYIRHVVDKPWNNHCLLLILIKMDKNYDVRGMNVLISLINSRLKDLFSFFNLKSMENFDVENHMYQYFKGSVFEKHSDDMRRRFLMEFSTASMNMKKWINSKLTNAQQVYFEQYIFSIPSYDSREFSSYQSAMTQRHNTRKSETDAIVPLLPTIRAEGNFRCNQLTRLRQAYLKACKEVETTNRELPLEFDYDEPDHIGERFYFCLWDKPSFVLNHPDKFSDSSIKAAYKRTGAYSDENNHYFIEYVKAERLEDNEESEGLWFIELFEKRVMGYWYKNNNDKEIKQKRELLYSWGYGGKDSNKNPTPFTPPHKGILTTNNFTSLQNKTEKIIFDVEPLYAASTFGLLALDIITSTGARINELLQISYTKKCLKTVKVENKLHYSFYAIPKGRDIAEPFYISEHTMKLIAKVIKLLKEHYGAEKIPNVKYRHNRKHLFPDPEPYIFQYNNMSFQDNTIYTGLRFLLHGLNFETQEGKAITVKAHLLRHAFATEAVQRQKLPIDIVAKILHQRDLGVTNYYSEPTPSQVSQSVSDLHDVISDYVDLDEAVLRNPEELEREIEEYKEKVGVFNNVVGGTCVTDYVCPTKMQCLGCHAKIPQPEKKHELLDVIELSKDMEKRFSSMNLTVEVKKAKTMRKHARNELKEIELIEKYREEQKYEPHIKFNK